MPIRATSNLLWKSALVGVLALATLTCMRSQTAREKRTQRVAPAVQPAGDASAIPSGSLEATDLSLEVRTGQLCEADQTDASEKYLNVPVCRSYFESYLKCTCQGGSDASAAACRKVVAHMFLKRACFPKETSVDDAFLSQSCRDDFAAFQVALRERGAERCL